jgi:hypothetical protein
LEHLSLTAFSKRVRRPAPVLAVALLCTGMAVGGCGGNPKSSDAGAAPTKAPPPAPKPPFRFFSPTSFWNTSPSGDAALDPDSADLVGALEDEVVRERESKSGPWINTTSYSVPIYTVPAGQATVRVRLLSEFAAPALRSAWSAVPLPAGAQPAAGSDGHLVLWQPSSDRLWEFWRLESTPEGWQASWGGAIQDVSSNSGAYGPGSWPGATSSWGASASSLSIAGGLITLEDLERGQIDHALAISLPVVRKGVFAAPAMRTDGTSSSPLSLPEGAHLRLDPSLNLASLHLAPLTMMMAEAAQRYGLFVRDRASVVSFDAQTPRPGTANPYAGPGGYFEGKYPGQLLASFPWSHLQVLAMGPRR